MSPGAKNTFPDDPEVNCDVKAARGTTCCGRGLKSLKFRTVATVAAIDAGIESSVEGAKCLIPPAAKKCICVPKADSTWPTVPENRIAFRLLLTESIANPCCSNQF